MRDNQKGMTLIVKAATRILFGLIFVYGVFIVLDGHHAPGGGFAGGLIIALSFIQLLLAFGRGPVLEKLDINRSLYLSAIGIIIFLVSMALVLLGSGLAARLIPLCDIAVALMVSAGIFAVFLALILSCELKEEK